MFIKNLHLSSIAIELLTYRRASDEGSSRIINASLVIGLEKFIIPFRGDGLCKLFLMNVGFVEFKFA